MKSYPFYQIDVFSSLPLCGNPLAVFLDCENLETSVLQAIAREMNLSETAFVFPADQAGSDFKVRIFTPEKEIPFAGHPTLGTADVLRQLGMVDEKVEKLVLQLGTGPMEVIWRDGKPFMQQKFPEFEKPFQLVYRLGEALGIAQQAIHTWWPAQVASTGFPALLVPLQNLKQVQDIRLNLRVLEEILGAVDMIYPFSLETLGDGVHVHGRGFAPFVGIPEDPATGSVAGALGGYLAAHRVLGEEADYSQIRIEQGLEMHRPSLIDVRVENEGNSPGAIWVGGATQMVMQGQLSLP